MPKIETRSINDLIPYARNSRTHSDEQVAQIAASLKEFGWTNPILIDGDNGIIAGHGRLMAARKIRDSGASIANWGNHADVPVISLAHMTDTQRRAYIIADNKLALNAGWDDELLRVELEELKSLDFDLGLTGFDADELDTLMGVEIPAGLVDDDEVPEPPVKPVTVLGDVWVLGKHRLMCGDSTSIADIEKLTDGALVDIWLTDPPYNVAYEGKTKDAMTIQNDSMTDDSFRQFLRDSFVAADAVMKGGGSVLYLAC